MTHIYWPVYKNLEKELLNLTYSNRPEEIAMRFKHRIVAIHCFPHGNGRHSIMMAAIIIESVFGNELFYWHQSNMVQASETRRRYSNALRAADHGNLALSIQFTMN